jgi:hypothetical protein
VILIFSMTTQPMLVELAIWQNLDLTFHIASLDHPGLKDRPFGVVAKISRSLPVGAELNPVASVRAEFLAGNVGRGDRPAFVGKGSCDGERNETYGSDPDADERLHGALTDCCNDTIRLF